jgi:hypothetical protein
MDNAGDRPIVSFIQARFDACVLVERLHTSFDGIGRMEDWGTHHSLKREALLSMRSMRFEDVT